MRRIGLLTFILAFAAVVQPIAASAQDKSCSEEECRALGTFRTCKRPRDGAIIFSARVLASSKECPNNILWVRVEDGKASNLPTVVEIDLGPCVSFSGEVGEVIQIALNEPHRPDVRRYRGLACRIW
jgi:hypothetical protein